MGVMSRYKDCNLRGVWVWVFLHILHPFIHKEVKTVDKIVSSLFLFSQ